MQQAKYWRGWRNSAIIMAFVKRTKRREASASLGRLASWFHCERPVDGQKKTYCSGRARPCRINIANVGFGQIVGKKFCQIRFLRARYKRRPLGQNSYAVRVPKLPSGSSDTKTEQCSRMRCQEYRPHIRPNNRVFIKDEKGKSQIRAFLLTQVL